MHLFLCTILLFVFASDIKAQDETIFKSNGKSGGFGAPVIKLTSIKNQTALMIGGRGGWIIGRSFVIGGGGYGVVSEVNASEGVLPSEGPLDIEFGYGGLELEYIINTSSLIHFSSYVLIAAGTNNYVKDAGSVFESNEQSGETDLVFVLEPAVNVEINITDWFRLNSGLSYRVVTGVNQPGLDNNDFTGLAAALSFKFGNF